MRTTFLNLILLFVIVGCKQPTINKVQQAVEAQAKLLVDSGLIANEYVVLYELAINDSNHIYSIQAADCPADLKFEYPSKIIKYKDKYLCFIELDEAPMSAKEMIAWRSGSPQAPGQSCGRRRRGKELAFGCFQTWREENINRYFIA